jgi:hypothetical protein
LGLGRIPALTIQTRHLSDGTGFFGLTLAEEVNLFKWNWLVQLLSVSAEMTRERLEFPQQRQWLERDRRVGPLQHKVGRDLRGVFRIPVTRRARGPRWFPNGDAIPKQNQLGGTVVSGKSHGGPFMQFTDEICNQF